MQNTVNSFINRRQVLKSIRLLLAMLFVTLPVSAQNIGGVFGPVVNEGHKSAEYRIGYDPEGYNGGSSFAHRVHYKHAINDDFMGRLVLQTRKTSDSSTDYDFVQGELFWQLTNETKHKTGLRFDFRLRDNNRANQIGVNWMHQFALADNWQTRLVLLANVQFGDNKADGIALGSRANLAKNLANSQLGVEWFSSYGRTGDLNGLSDQSHTIGPFYTAKIGNTGWQFYTGALFGITSASDDTTFRLRVAKTF